MVVGTETDEVVVTETDEVVVTETDEVVVTETDEVVVTETDEVVVTETDEVGGENATRIAIEVQNARMEVKGKSRVGETDRQEMNKKKPMEEGRSLADDRGTEIGTVQTKMAPNVMEGKVPASIAMKGDIPIQTKAPLPLTKRPKNPLLKSLAALVSFWLIYSEANRLAKINPQEDAITWKFSEFAVVLP
jgi:hypothetical protein